MSKKPYLLPALLLAMLAGTAHAADISEKLAAQIKASIARHTDGKVQVEQLHVTPLSGIYEAVAEGEIFYVDATGRYGFLGGSLMDIQQRQDLTALQMDKRMAIPFESLPLQHAIKEVRGDGSQVFAVFEDPYCPICQVFTKFLDQLDDVTIYRFMFPVIRPESASLARMAWCSADRATVWKELMAGTRLQLNENCNVDGLLEVLTVGERYKINNTPTVILANGKRLVGATPPEQFLQELQNSRESRKK